MKYSDELNMAIAAVSMDRMLDMKTKQQIIEALAELERLAEIGGATERAFESGFSINQMHSVLSNVDYCMYDKESLLNWAEEEVSND